ncbi:hypothetical protein FRACYDRAFT_236159 [Fragilariopsis cylindrus CCMP1102]|uniref:C3H1-type domain-containing protein n=1 Tax=Fragilariopsis cylindrus CCMP1102 TaxID=635003 RepID=A0A1E7FPL1_9STRA|nr:hypothetical protein FRACYDRAFT_236159 [Fragilariopsis cylindrus CCMP1102]|eukprot:OEU20091.1 hypothetical protein FRACYDRAFT_236159 [Fragilariopsis cylindrus CCMP1102]
MMMRSYQYCSKEECIDRQELRQVSELEVTLETCHQPQSKRILDVRLAVSKYRRSAAGDDRNADIRGRDMLTATLSHLTTICSTFQATSNHPRIDDIDVIVNFVADRVRSCQADATRLMSGTTNKDCVPASWHARTIRILIWLQYCCGGSSNSTRTDTVRMLSHMRSTAYDAYWNSRRGEENDGNNDASCDDDDDDDDEILCYSAISMMCSISLLSRPATMTLQTSWNGILLEFSKRRRQSFSYPLWNVVLEIACHADREQYFFIWKNNRLSRELPILAKCCLSEVLLLWRYRTVQQYNASFAKGESVVDMDRLLGITSSSSSSSEESSRKNDCCWSIEYANVFGVPVVSSSCNNDVWDDNVVTTSSTTSGISPKITMTLKQVSIPEFDQDRIDNKLAAKIRNCDQKWVFGEAFDDTTPMGIASDTLCRLLEFGSLAKNSDRRNTAPNNNNGYYNKITTPLIVPNGVDNNKRSINTTTSRTATSSTRPSSLSNALTSSRNATRTRPSSSSNALGKIKKKKNPCRFYAKGTCRSGDKCRFDHTNMQ